MGNSCSAVCRVAGDDFDGVFLCCLFFPRDVLDEIWDLTESVSEGFPTYSYSNIRLFADDTSLSIVVENLVSAAQMLNSDLDKNIKWAKTWLVNFNPVTTETLLLSRKLLQTMHPPLYMLNQQISEADYA